MRKRMAGIVATAAMAAALSPSACSDPVTPILFIAITNTWHDVTNEDHRFSFQSDDDGEAEGTFSGLEFVDEQDFEGIPLTGSWANNTIQFTVQRQPPVTYTGRLRSPNPDSLTFDSPAGQLRIARN